MQTLLVTPAEAASALRISRSKLYEILADGSLSSVKIGGARRIRVSDLEAFIEALTARVA